MKVARFYSFLNGEVLPKPIKRKPEFQLADNKLTSKLVVDKLRFKSRLK